MKKIYQKPELKLHGSLEKMTQGASTGTVLDRAFDTGTPISHLTFS